MSYQDIRKKYGLVDDEQTKIRKKYGLVGERKTIDEYRTERELKKVGKEVQTYVNDWQNFWTNGGTIGTDAYSGLTIAGAKLDKYLGDLQKEYAGNEQASNYFTQLSNALHDIRQQEYSLHGANVNRKLFDEFQGVSDTLDSYSARVDKGEWLTAEDLSGYRNAANRYSQLGDQLFTEANGYTADEVRKYQTSKANMRTLAASANNLYSAYADEDTFLAENAWNAEHGTLEARQNWANGLVREKERLGANMRREIDAAMQSGDISQVFSIQDKYGALIDGIDSELLHYERGEYNEDGYYYGSKKVDEYFNLTQNADFGENSGRQQDNYATGTNRDWVSGEVYSDSNPDVLGVYHDLKEGKLSGHQNVWAQGEAAGWSELTEDEVSLYYYIGNTQGWDKAVEFLNDISVTLDYRKHLTAMREWQEAYDQSGFLGKAWMYAQSFPQKAISGVMSRVENAYNWVSGQDYNPYSYGNQGMHKADLTRSNVFSDLGDAAYSVGNALVGEKTGKAFENATEFAASVITSVIDSKLGFGLLGKTGGSIIMYSSAAQSEAYRLYQQGASETQMLLGAAATGLAEMVFERYSFDKLVTMKNPQTFLQKVWNQLKQGGIEASEEVFTEASNLITNSIIMGRQSDLQKMYRETGSWKEVGMDIAGRLLEAGAGGFIGGVAGGGAMGWVNYAATQKANRDIGSEIIKTGGVETLKGMTAEGASSRRINKLSNKVTDADSRSNARNVGQLYGEITRSIAKKNANANAADVAEALQEGGISEKDASRLANAIIAQQNGTATDRQNDFVDQFAENDTVHKVMRDIVLNQESSVGQRSKSIREFNDAVSYVKGINKALDAADMRIVTGKLRDGGIEADKVNDVAVALAAVHSGTATKEQKQLLEEFKGNEAVANANQYLQDAAEDKLTVDTYKAMLDRGGVATGAEESAEYEEMDAAAMTESFTKAGIPAATAQQLAESYDAESGVVSGAFAEDVRLAFKYGKLNFKEGLQNLRLSESQANEIFNMGAESVEVAPTKLESTRKIIKDSNANKPIYYDNFTYNKHQLNPTQRASMEAIQMINKLSNLEVHVYKSYKKDGKFYTTINGEERIAPNGYFTNGNQIHIDLNAGQVGEGTMLYTLAHEIGHYIAKWNAADFKAISDFLFEHYAASTPVAELIEAKKEVVRKSYKMDKKPIPGDAQLEQEAQEELVCDMLSKVLADQHAYDVLMELKQKDLRLFRKLGRAIKLILQRLGKAIGVYQDQEPAAWYAASTRNFGEKAFRELQELYVMAFEQADANYLESLTPGEEGTVFSEDGEPVAHATEDGTVQLSMRTYEEEGKKALEKYLKKCVKNKRLTDDEMQEMMNGIDDIYKTCKEFKDKYAPFSTWSDASVVRDTRGKPVFRVVTPNGDYKMNLDFSLVCKKRRTLDAVFNEMARRGIIDDFELGQKSVVKINEIIRKYGLETACALCFVDAKRFRQASMADSFVRLYNELVESLVPEDQRSKIERFNFGGYDTIGKVENGIHTWDKSKLDFTHLDNVMKNYEDGTVEYKAAKYIKSHAEGRKLLLRGDFMSSKGFDAVKTQNPNVLKLYNSKKGTGGPKAAFGDVQYMNEIIEKARFWTPEKAYAVGGIRVQSFSDYVPRMVFDYVQMVYDMAATKLPAHAYTKEALFAKQFGLTGIKINMSLIPAIAKGGIAPGLDADGNYVWAGESFDFETAKQIQNAEGYTENCGTICVGVSYQHILKLLSDPDIRMVIPYHKSGLNPIVAHMNQIAEFTDYTSLKTNPGGCQNTMNKNGSKVEVDFNFNKVLRETGDPKKTVRQYLDWCAEHEYTPRFAEFAWHENYYKLIEDFTLYDKDGKYVPQRAVKATFPKDGNAFGSMKGLIQEGLQEDAVIEGKREKNLPAIVNEIQQTIPKTEAEISEEEVTQADRDLESGTMFSMRDTVEETKDLLAFHNITEKLLWDVLNRKSLIMPSLAITNKGMHDFGEISLLFDKSTIDPNQSRENKLYGADAWTPTQTDLKKNAKFDTDKTVRAVNNMKNRIGSKYVSELLNITPKQFKDTILQADGSIYDAYAHNIGVQAAYAMEHGIISRIPTTKSGAVDMTALRDQLNKELDTDNGWRQYKKWLNNISDTVITSYDQASNEDILNNMKAQPASAKTFKLSETGELVVPAAEYGSIKDLRNNKSRLSENAEEAAKAVADEFMALAKAIGNNTKTVVDAINTAFAARYNTADIIKAFRKQGINISSRTAGELQSLYKKAVELPTQYFEAKPGREVALDEIKAVVMPANSSPELHSTLEELGIDVIDYDGTKESRTKALNSVESLKFSERVSNQELAGMDETALYIKNTDKANYIGMIFNGTKTEETRSRRTLDAFIGRDFYVTDGKYVYGSIVLGEPHKYTEEEFRKVENQRKHRVPKGDQYDIKPGGTKWAYPIESYRKFDKPKKLSDSTEYKNSFQARQVVYQERTEGIASNRELLAGALETVAKDDTERKNLSNYKKNIEMLNAEEEKLTGLEKELHGLMFAKGPRNSQKMAELREEIAKTTNRINTYDGRLLRMEASTPLRNLLTRERRKGYKKASEEAVEKINKIREKLSTKQMREKVMRVVKELNSMLQEDSKKRHVPDSLKKAVAGALDILNLDTTNTEERVAKYQKLIAEETDPDKIDAYQVTLENILRAGEKMGEKLSQLHTAYQEIKDSKDPDIQGGYDSAIDGAIKELAVTIGTTPINKLSIEQLEDVYNVFRGILTRVRDANKSLVESIKESISVRSSHVISEVKAAGGTHADRLAALDGVKRFGWNNLKPVYAFEEIGSQTLTEAFNNVRRGEDTWALDVTAARAYFLRLSKEYGYDNLDMDKVYTFEAIDGQKFELTLEQMMSLYAYSKRAQADDHLRLGGFVFDSNIEFKKEKVKDEETGEVVKKTVLKYKKNTADAHQIDLDTMQKIVETVSGIAGVKDFVDGMQDYLSTTMGAKGNEVTMKMYGIKLFKEENYFPLKSAKQFLFEQNEVSGEVRIKNSGFTNKLVAGANNPIILSNFMDVWCQHVNDMSMYHAFTLPLEDFNRIFNYTTGKAEGMAPKSVKGTIQDAYSPAAVSYIKQLITDLNGGAVSDPREFTGQKLMGKWKKAKVMASLSVVIQQPTSIARAFAMVDPKYFVGKKTGMTEAESWEELKKYAPVAIIKEMGYFDTGMGLGVKDFIQQKDYEGLKEKAKGVLTDSNYRDEVLGKAPAKADEITWVAIWNAVKRETAGRHPDLQPGTKEYLKAAGERFTEVVTMTQVYDSVLARSANMRSKGTFMNMATAFLAEPTTTINMAIDAIVKWNRGEKKLAVKILRAVMICNVINNMLSSLVYAMRDDDEEETFIEKYMQSLVSGLIDDLNPMTYFPWLKDVWSILQGYDVNRSDMSLISDAFNAGKGLIRAYDRDENLFRAWLELSGSVGNFLGVPVENMIREGYAFGNTWNTWAKDWGVRDTTWGSLGDAIGEALKNSAPVYGIFASDSKTDDLYDAVVSGDQKYLERFKGGYVDKDGNFDESKYNTALKQGLRDNDERIREAAEARIDGDYKRYNQLLNEIKTEGKFSHSTIRDAIFAEENDIRKDNGEGEKEKSKSEAGYEASFTNDDYFSAVLAGDTESAKMIYKDLMDSKLSDGYLNHEAADSISTALATEIGNRYMDGEISRNQAVKLLTDNTDKGGAEVKKWDFEMKYGFSWSNRARRYRNGKISRKELENWVMDIEGADRDEARAYVDFLDLEIENPNVSITAADAESYFANAKPANIDISTYLEFKDKVSGIKGDIDPKTGKAKSGSKKEKVLKYIHSLPLTVAQKDALYRSQDYAENDIKNAPWH